MKHLAPRAGAFAAALIACAGAAGVAMDDLRLRDDATPRQPEALTQDEIGVDLAVLLRFLERGYGGRRFVPGEIFDQVVAQLASLSAQRPTPDGARFCDQIADVLWALPDNHLAAYTREGRCGMLARAERRVPQVGPNIANGGGPDVTPVWSLRQLAIAGRAVPALSIARLPPQDDDAWEGYGEMLGTLLEGPALIIDLRGNGGGDDSRGFELAAALLGREHSPFIDAIIRRQNPETFLLRMNAARLSQRGYERRKEAVPQYLIDDYAEFQSQFEEALGGELPEEHEDVIELDAPSEDPPAFQNPVLVLVDAECASSCEGTLLALKTHPQAVVIGENTGGYLQFGNTGLAVLPHSQIAVQIPTLFFRLRGGASYEKTGVPPDVAVAPGTDALNEARARLERHFAAQE